MGWIGRPGFIRIPRVRSIPSRASLRLDPLTRLASSGSPRAPRLDPRPADRLNPSPPRLDPRKPHASSLCIPTRILCIERMGWMTLANSFFRPKRIGWNGLADGPVNQRAPIRPLEQQPTGQLGQISHSATQTAFGTRSDGRKSRIAKTNGRKRKSL